MRERLFTSLTSALIFAKSPSRNTEAIPPPFIPRILGDAFFFFIPPRLGTKSPAVVALIARPRWNSRARLFLLRKSGLSSDLPRSSENCIVFEASDAEIGRDEEVEWFWMLEEIVWKLEVGFLGVAPFGGEYERGKCSWILT